jgi:hypothetical protein
MGYAHPHLERCGFRYPYTPRVMISRNFQQADTIIELARTTILDNTKALENIHQALMEHIRQKEVIVDKMKECRKDRDTKFTELLKKKKYD